MSKIKTLTYDAIVIGGGGAGMRGSTPVVVFRPEYGV